MRKLNKWLATLLAIVITALLIPVSAAAATFDSTATIAAEHWHVDSSGEYSAAFTFDDLEPAGLNPGLYSSPAKVDENKVNLYVTSSNMSSDYEIPNFKDKVGNTWYLNSIAVSNFSSLLGISTGNKKEIFTSSQIKNATNKTDYDYNLSQIDIGPATVDGIDTKYYFIRYGWTPTPPDKWEDGGSGEPQDTYHVTYDFELPAEDMILYPIEYNEDLGENRINVDSDGGIIVGSQVTAMNTTIQDGLNFVVAGALASEYKGFLIFTKEENPTYYYLDGWKIGGTKYEMGETVQASAGLAGEQNTITVQPNWVKIEPLTEDELEEAAKDETLKVDPLVRDGMNVAEDVLLTQWTNTDENENINGQKTANNVLLDETGTISYRVSALVNYAGVTDPDRMSYSSDFASFTFALDIDKQLEFANVADDGTVTVDFQSSVLKPTGTNIINGDAEGATISQNGDNWTITFNPAPVPKNEDGSMRLEVTVQWIGGKHTDGGVTRPLIFSGLDFKLKNPVADKENFEINTSVNVTGEMNLQKKVPANLRVYYRVIRGQLEGSEEWQTYFGESYNPEAFVHTLQFMNYKLAKIDMSKDHSTLEANTVTATYTQYTITASAGTGGSISPSDETKVYKGADQTFTITPDSGYKIADVKVDGNSVGAVKSYTFKNVTANHTIEATFEKIPTKPTDPPYIPPVDPDEPADPDDTGVSDLLNTKDHDQYLFGYPEGTFGPGLNMTRAEAAQMFYNLLVDQDVTAKPVFDDVPEGAWYAEPVNVMAKLDIVEGVGDNKFEPNREITRAEFTAMAMRFAEGETGGKNIFSDVDEDDWFYEVVVDSIKYGWIEGYPDGTFRPQNLITREEVTTIVNRMLGRLPDEKFIDAHEDDLDLFPDVTKNWAYYDVVEATNDHQYKKTSSGEDWTKLG